MIWTLVGVEKRAVEFELFASVHGIVADGLRGGDLVGDELDLAISARMPLALALALDRGRQRRRHFGDHVGRGRVVH